MLAVMVPMPSTLMRQESMKVEVVIAGLSSASKVALPLPSGLHAGIELAPSFVVLIRIQVVGLLDVELTAVAGLFHKGRVARRKTNSRNRLRHATLLARVLYPHPNRSDNLWQVVL